MRGLIGGGISANNLCANPDYWVPRIKALQLLAAPPKLLAVVHDKIRHAQRAVLAQQHNHQAAAQQPKDQHPPNASQSF